MHTIDIALISETHFTSRTVFHIPHYTVENILRNSLRHFELMPHQSEATQAATFQTWHPPIALDGIYPLLSPASRHSYGRLHDVLHIPGTQIPNRRGLERQKHCLGSTAHYT
jgi:hypothetical protein